MTIDSFFQLFPPSNVIASIALLISLYTFIQTYGTGFDGQMWFSDEIILGESGSIQSICLMCSIENFGSTPGILEDIRLQVKTQGNQATFYPLVTKEDYSFYEIYTKNDWRQFSTILLPAKQRIETHIFFTPLNNKFHSISEGKMEVYLEARWHSKNKWENITRKVRSTIKKNEWVNVGKIVSFTLTDVIAENWNKLTDIPIQVFSDDFRKHRN